MRCAFDTCLLVVHRDAGAHAQGSGNGESEQGASARLQGAVGALIRRLTERAAPGLAVPVVNGCMGEAFHVRRHVTHRPRGCKVSFVKYHISVCVQNNTTNTNRARPAAPPGAAQPNGSDPARAPALWLWAGGPAGNSSILPDTPVRRMRVRPTRAVHGAWRTEDSADTPVAPHRVPRARRRPLPASALGAKAKSRTLSCTHARATPSIFCSHALMICGCTSALPVGNGNGNVSRGSDVTGAAAARVASRAPRIK